MNATVRTRSALSCPALLVALPLLALAFGCEDKAIGRPCSVLVDAGEGNALENDQALECPTRLCIKPAKDNPELTLLGTKPFCTAECSDDSDCEDGQRRDPNNVDDKRCSGGFTCAVTFETGDLKCKKLCVCKDFVGDKPVPIPASCGAGN
jgi:hypothetical protein